MLSHQRYGITNSTVGWYGEDNLIFGDYPVDTMEKSGCEVQLPGYRGIVQDS
jgi:hypothetical protein